MTEPPILSSASPIGFGAYRVEATNPTHRTALEHALDAGCRLIDTASNYTDGASEKLIGEVLAGRDFRDSAVVMTKVGYVSPSMMTELAAAGVDVTQLSSISDESRYSLMPKTIGVQLAVSRRRLQTPRLDVALLHNPEHCVGEISCATIPAFLNSVRTGLEVLEEEVALGRLAHYGISSNALPTLDIEMLDAMLELFAEMSASGHLRVVQFPFNILEREAAAPTDKGSLIDRLSAMGIVSVGHRLLSSPRCGGIRFASYDTATADPTALYRNCVSLVEDRLREENLPHKAADFMVIQFLRDNREGVVQPDVLDAIFSLHVYPFVAQLWPEDGEGFQAFHGLHEALRGRLLEKLDAKASLLRAEFRNDGILDPRDVRPLHQIACEFGLRSGLGHVVVGMRRPEYVDALLPLFRTEAHAP